MGRGTVFNLIMLAIRLVDGGLVTIDASRGHRGAGGNAGVVRRITTHVWSRKSRARSWIGEPGERPMAS